jgi:hypothetical protein
MLLQGKTLCFLREIEEQQKEKRREDSQNMMIRKLQIGKKGRNINIFLSFFYFSSAPFGF